MRRFTGAFALVIIGLLIVWIALYPSDWQNWLGFSRADYFRYGTNYAFASGPGPMLLTAIGMSTIIAGLWHAVNCHADGCWRIARHKVNGSPWCNHHHEMARILSPATLDTISAQLTELISLMKLHWTQSK